MASQFIKGLISVQGLTILTSGVLMGLSVQFDSAIVNLDSFAYPKFVWLVRVVIFVATPVIPVVLILREVNLTTKKRGLEAEWVRKQELICKLYLKQSKLDREKRKVMKALADMKMVEVSTEGVPQLFILIVLIIFSSPDFSCDFGLWENGDLIAITFLVLSLLQTYITIIVSTIASIDIRKGGQLGVKSKIVLGLSVSCQLAAKLWIMLSISVAVISPEEAIPLDMTIGVLLLMLPIPIGWVFTLLLHKLLSTDFWLLSTKDKLIHLLSTTWFTVPVRRMEDRSQRHKGRETFFALVLAGLNIVGASAATMAITTSPYLTVLLSYFLLEEVQEQRYPTLLLDQEQDQDQDQEQRYHTLAHVIRLIFIMLPSLFFHLAGCGWLLLFEKTVHPWRQLGKERERHCWGKLQGTKKGIETEPTILDQVSFSCYKPLNSVHFQEEVTMGEEEGSTEEEIEKVKNEIYFEASCLYCRKVLLM